MLTIIQAAHTRKLGTRDFKNASELHMRRNYMNYVTSSGGYLNSIICTTITTVRTYHASPKEETVFGDSKEAC